MVNIKDVQKQLAAIIRRSIKEEEESYGNNLRRLFRIIDEDPDKTRLKELDKQNIAQEFWDVCYEGPVKELKSLLFIINNPDKFKEIEIQKLKELDEQKKLLSILIRNNKKNPK